MFVAAEVESAGRFQGCREVKIVIGMFWNGVQGRGSFRMDCEVSGQPSRQRQSGKGRMMRGA